MPNARPLLTDRAALARNRARADPGALFLHREARAEIEDRIALVNRTFTDPAVVTGFPDEWALPGARVVPDDDTLDLRPGSHDLVVHAMALHWADDPLGQIIQCRRALRPDGLFLAVFLGGATLSELRAALATAETRLTGGLSPRIAPMAEIRDMGALLQRAGLALPVADADRRTVTYADARALMRDLRAMGEGNALAARHRRTPRRALFARAEALMPRRDGRLEATFEMIHLAGFAPSEDQPRPLRPGSATHRLADALGTAETKLPD
ncbi:MAG: methyltransferase domain-containing protein [Hasllibacter sp.]